MATTKKLNIEIPEIKVIRPHFDNVNPYFSEEHYSCYVLYKQNEKDRSIHSRIYLEYSLGKDFRKVLLDSINVINRSSGFSNYKKSKISLLDNYPEFRSFIKDCVVKIIPENLSRLGTTNYISGIRVFLNIMRFMKYSFDKISDIKLEHQNVAWNNTKNLNCSKKDEQNLFSFFNAVSNYSDDFILQRKSIKRSTSSIIGLPTTTLFAIDYYCRQDIDDNIKKFNETKKWLAEYKAISNLFSLSNLAHTLYKGYEINKTNQRKILLDLALLLHNTNLECWIYVKRYKKKNLYFYKNTTQESEHNRLIEISKNGLDIMLNTEKMYFFWMIESVPNLLRPLEKNEVYGEIINWEKLYFNGRRSHINIDELRKRIYPLASNIYPLYLFLLIREGLNDETLKNWKISVDNDKKYNLGENLGVVTIVQGLKNRTKDIQWTPISRNSLSQKYINFYLEWLSPIYAESEFNYFFQYGIIGGQNIYDHVRPGVWKANRKSKEWFFKKHKIYMPDGTRLGRINHNQPRVNVQFNDYLRGLNEWERQYRKNHKSIDTQIHYDNMDERKVVQRHKIGKVFNLIEGIFRGTITSDENKKVKVFNGLFADCSDPKNPTYPGAIKIGKNEICSDWFMCLIFCNKSQVDPKIHGPAIMAYSEYMNEQRAYLSDENWEKEYELQNSVALEIIEKKMNKEQRIYCEQNMHRYYDLVQKQFKRKRLLKENFNVG